MNPLEHKIQDLICREGPISLETYMALALADPEYGYYMTRDPFGAAGDFGFADFAAGYRPGAGAHVHSGLAE